MLELELGAGLAAGTPPWVKNLFFFLLETIVRNGTIVDVFLTHQPPLRRSNL